MSGTAGEGTDALPHMFETEIEATAAKSRPKSGVGHAPIAAQVRYDPYVSWGRRARSTLAEQVRVTTR